MRITQYFQEDIFDEVTRYCQRVSIFI